MSFSFKREGTDLVGAVGNAFCAFSKERWARLRVRGSVSFHRLQESFSTMRTELGHVVGSAIGLTRVERPMETSAPTTWTVSDIQWEVAPRAPVQG